MLAKKYRATRADIAETIKSGANISGDFLYAKVSRTDAAKAGFAIVISKKVEKTSVGRHLIKRRISAALERYSKKIPPHYKKTIVFFAKKAPTTVSYQKIQREIEDILKKIFTL